MDLSPPGSQPLPLQSAAIGLGSNLPSPAGDPARTLHAAFDALAELGSVTARSSLYRTAPVGPVVDQPEFLNAAALLETSLSPAALLAALLAIESRFGRDRAASPRKGPRTLDLDLLLYGDLVVDLPGLLLPHPALAERRFVLAPLAEIAPERQHPVLRRSVAELLSLLPLAGPHAPASVQRLR